MNTKDKYPYFYSTPAIIMTYKIKHVAILIKFLYLNKITTNAIRLNLKIKVYIIFVGQHYKNTITPLQLQPRFCLLILCFQYKKRLTWNKYSLFLYLLLRFFTSSILTLVNKQRVIITITNGFLHLYIVTPSVGDPVSSWFHYIPSLSVSLYVCM